MLHKQLCSLICPTLANSELTWECTKKFPKHKISATEVENFIF